MVEYETKGVCSRKIQFAIQDGIVKDVFFLGGCNGNLKGISNLVEGMKVEDVINKLEGIKCGSKNTSCPAQLAIALKQQAAAHITPNS
ncbi:TIGR03905 family TSCPD domain-containing protein [Sporomusa acidovorans]|uniref:ribonucleoside-diphosphate reductase n=1 Tax=Sporomusa acidovorans (strain ATCC 49682 / DSM 3132 / Mol) TaxID=1123286 RepID=A0ABZ3J7I6_SPOA4|nr:TIGR03905 family TSCPD domain-containing protein [Sporomusa acidovorans]OZC18517.1 TSCPD domain protein [Sporomusa acidovorans DSM 3132]SDE37070.1 uncharacterized protein TIGR03905 [Sporomusa acidovorans]